MRIKGVVSRIFCSKPSGFKILVLEVNISQQVPQKYINPEFPASVSAAGVMKEADIGYVVEIDGEWEHRDSGRFWPWQVKVTGCTVCVFETPQLLAEIIGGIEESPKDGLLLWTGDRTVAGRGIELPAAVGIQRRADEKSRRKIKRTQGKRRPESVPASLWSE